jgi:hypothetical protein
MAKLLDPPAIVEQQKQSKFICSACGSARDCACDAPALERLAAIKEQTRQRTIKAREKAKENQQSCSATAPRTVELRCEGNAQAQEPRAIGLQIRRGTRGDHSKMRDYLAEASQILRSDVKGLMRLMRPVEREQLKAAFLEIAEELERELAPRS